MANADDTADILKRVLDGIKRIERRMDREDARRAAPSTQDSSSSPPTRGIKRTASERDDEAPGSELFSLHFNYNAAIMKHLMELTVYLWAENTEYPNVEMDEVRSSELRQFFDFHSTVTTGVSGLSLLLFSVSTHKSRVEVFSGNLANAFIGMISLVVHTVFHNVRTSSYRHWDEDSNDFALGAGPYANINAPRYMTNELCCKYGESELDFTHGVVHELFLRPSSKYGYVGLQSGSPGGNGNGPVQGSDLSDLRTRCVMMKHVHKQVRKVMNDGRNHCRNRLFKLLFFVVRKMMAIKDGGGNPQAQGCFIEWKDETTGRDTHHISGLNALDIPKSRESMSNDADTHNLEQFYQLKRNYPDMKCTLHYRCIVRPPIDHSHSAQMDHYAAELAKFPTPYIYVPRTVDIDFYQLAVIIWDGVYGKHSGDQLTAVLKSSRHSLGAIHIFALGLRALVARASDLQCTEAELNAMAAVSVEDNTSSNEDISFIMKGARALHNDNDRSSYLSSQNTRTILEARLTSMSFEEYLMDEHYNADTAHADVAKFN